MGWDAEFSRTWVCVGSGYDDTFYLATDEKRELLAVTNVVFEQMNNRKFAPE